MEPDSSAIDFFRGQPYPVWEEARRSECPVIAGGGMSLGPTTTYQVTRYHDAEQVLRDGETFSSTINAEHIGQFMGDLILAMDGAEHRQYRNLVAKAFRASQLERWDETLVRPMINSLLDAIAPQGRADLVVDVTSKYPVQVICGIVGRAARGRRAVPPVGRADQHGPAEPGGGHAASQAMVDYLRPLVEARGARTRSATSSPTSCTPRSTVSSSPTARSTASCACCCPRARETTFRVMGNCLFALLSHPDALAAVVRRS